MKSYFVYILSSKTGTLYIGMTNNLQRRIYEHKHKLIDGFSKKYNISRLVYYETFYHPNDAIFREKQLKKWSRAKKKTLIETLNPRWLDLSREWD